VTSFGFASDLDLVRSTLAGLGIQRGKRADSATSLSQTLKTGGRKSGGNDKDAHYLVESRDLASTELDGGMSPDEAMFNFVFLQNQLFNW